MAGNDETASRAGLAQVARPARDRASLAEPPDALASAGHLEVRVAASEGEIRRAQRLRYRVFFEEGGAVADPAARMIRRDVCRFDSVCDHLIVVDTSVAGSDGAPAVVGAYRLLRQDVAEAHFGFYSAGEFDIGALLDRHPGKRFLELGRSCVEPGYRGKSTLELLWRGIWAYALAHGVDAMFGCASFPGVDVRAHAATLRFLRGEVEAPPKWRVDALPGLAAPDPPDGSAPVEPRVVARALPPLVKGYWRLGAKFSRQAVVDLRFRTTDVFVVLPVEDIQPKYLAYFAPPHENKSAAA
jgi:putative hemolysin